MDSRNTGRGGSFVSFLVAVGVLAIGAGLLLPGILKMKNVPRIAGDVALVSGLILMFIAGLWFLVVVFRESILWLLGCIFVPFASLIFLILHWREAKGPFFTQLVGNLIAIAAIAFLPGKLLPGIRDTVTGRDQCEFVTKWGSWGTGNGQFKEPQGLAVDSSGNVYVADRMNDRIQKFDSEGNFLGKFGSRGHGNGQFLGPWGIALDKWGNIYVVDGANHRIQKFDSRGRFILKWGSEGSADGQFSNPFDVAVDRRGAVYVAELKNNRIQKFDSQGRFILKWGSKGAGDGEFKGPWGIAVDSKGNVFVADLANSRIQKFDSSGNFLTTWGSHGSGDGEFKGPTDIAVDSGGNVYVVDWGRGHPRIQKFGPSGKFLTKWGSEGSRNGEFAGFDGRGLPSPPKSIAVDSSGNVFVADTGNNRIQKFRRRR